jgi:CubicO group peptidase (beta-lactamase class C family)
MTSETSALSDIMESGVREGIFPGGVLQVSVGGQDVHRSAHGCTSVHPPGTAVTHRTCFDLASLTKVLAAAPLVVDLIQRGKLDLRDSVREYVAEFSGDGRENITVEHLLEHSSGLPDWRAYYEEVAAARGGAWLTTPRGCRAVRQMVASQTPEADPGERALYSDLGFILLDWIIEKAAGKATDVLFQRRVVKPLGLTDLFYVDLKSRSKARAARRSRVFAATERCPWRGRVLTGEVHDDNAFAMGGVSGHAGLFGDAESVAKVAAAWLDSYHGRASIFSPELTQKFFRRSGVPGSTRTLGFDTPAAGSRLGPRTVGHTGFTGTSLWIDPDRELVVLLLTNRVHPSRENEGIKEFRNKLHDLVVEGLS